MDINNTINTINTISMYALILSNVVVMYLPRFFIKQKETITGKAFKELYPESSWIRWGFILLYLIWLVIIFLIPNLYYSITKEPHWLFSILNAYAAIGLFYSLFTIVTGVMVMPSRSFMLRLVVGSKAFKVAKIQVYVSFGAIIVNSIIQFVLTR
jgi:hypothetical protein